MLGDLPHYNLRLHGLMLRHGSNFIFTLCVCLNCIDLQYMTFDVLLESDKLLRHRSLLPLFLKYWDKHFNEYRRYRTFLSKLSSTDFINLNLSSKIYHLEGSSSRVKLSFPMSYSDTCSLALFVCLKHMRHQAARN